MKPSLVRRSKSQFGPDWRCGMVSILTSGRRRYPLTSTIDVRTGTEPMGGRERGRYIQGGAPSEDDARGLGLAKSRGLRL